MTRHRRKFCSFALSAAACLFAGTTLVATAAEPTARVTASQTGVGGTAAASGGGVSGTVSGSTETGPEVNITVRPGGRAPDEKTARALERREKSLRFLESRVDSLDKLGRVRRGTFVTDKLERGPQRIARVSPEEAERLHEQRREQHRQALARQQQRQQRAGQEQPATQTPARTNTTLSQAPRSAR